MRQLFYLIFLFAAIIAGLQTNAQVVRPPIEANTVRALNELDARKTMKFRGDSLVKSEMAYIEWADDCFRFRRITTGAVWSDWLCIDDGEQTTIGVNAQSALEIISNAINFKVQNKHTVLQSDAGNNFVFKGNVILGENFTALGFGAGQSGYDSLVGGGDTILVPVFDNQFDNVILIGHGAQERAPNTAVIGDSSLVRIWTAAAVDASALEIKGDSVFLRHLVNLVESDSGKIAMHNGSGVVWIPQKADSIQINGEWVKLGGAFSFPDSIKVNGVWVHLGGSFTTPDAQNLSWNPETGALGISGGTGVDLDGRYLQTETPQNLSWNPETGALGIDGATGVDLDGRYLVPPTATDGDMMIFGSGSWYATAPIDDRVSVVDSEGVKSAPALLYADDFSVAQVGGAVDDWVVSVKPDSLAWNSGTRELSILGSNAVTIPDECTCTGATGTFYSKEGKLITVVNGLVVDIGVANPLAKIILTSTSTSSEWSPPSISNFGSELYWSVSGAVNTVAISNDPTFNFSAAGTKVITVTSPDGLVGVTDLNLSQLGLTDVYLAELKELNSLNLSLNALTELDTTGLSTLEFLYLNSNNITSFNATGLTSLTHLGINNNGLTSLDVSGLSNLFYVEAYNNNLTALDVTGLNSLASLFINLNALPSSEINSIIDSLVDFNVSGDTFDALNQTGGGCADLAKIQALDAIWEDVLVDTCAVEPWTYEGVMTVGDGGLGDIGVGFVNNNFIYGNLSPNVSFDNYIIYWASEDDWLTVYALNSNAGVFSSDPIILSIDGIEYELISFGGDNREFALEGTGNPFPAVGQTCEIKLRYTLAP